MIWPTVHRIRLVPKTRRRAVLHLFAAGVVLLALIPLVQPAHADTAPPDTCFLSGSGCAYLPPDLLNLNQSLYTATDAQRQSLQNLETTAISNTLADHGLPVTDREAVQSWGRSSAEAELFGLLKGAIATPATSRTPDQQNAVDWIAAIEQREAVTAAQDAGREYAKWAGLDQTAYRNLILNNASQSDLQNFLSTTPEGSLYNGGFCSYQAPTPYSTEYDPTSNAALCATTTGGGLGCVFSCVPNTPSYDQFVKWGEADESNASLSSSQMELAASSIAAGLIFGGVAVGAGVGGVAAGTGLASALIGSALQEAIIPYAAAVAYGADPAVGTAFASAEIAGSVGVITGILIVAITTAVVEGINVTNAAALPGKLAALIATAEATPPDPATLLNDTNGVQSLFSLFVGATLPQPSSGTCAGCLNAPPIPQPAFSDPYFIDVDTQIPGTQVGPNSYTQGPSGPTTTTTTNSITVADYTRGVTETARLSGHWFVLQPDGASAPTQSLSIAYTDWDGRQQVAWLVGDLTTGYQFVGYDATEGQRQGLDPATCLTNHICWKAPSLNYVGTDGNLHGASVQTPSAATATVSYHDAFQNQPFAAYEGDPEIFAVTNPSQSLDYKWEFEQTPPCPGPAFGCLAINPAFAPPPDYTAPLDDPGGALSQSGAIAHTWQTSGQYRVRLTTTDSLGRSTAYTFTVTVADKGPQITEDVFPQAYSAGTPFYSGLIYGQIQHAGTNDDEIVTLNWGDGSTDTATIGPHFGSPLVGVGGVIVYGQTPSLHLTADNTGNIPIVNYAYSGPHTYAQGGIYHVTVSVIDQGGLTSSQTQDVTIYNQRPTMSSVAPTSAPIGSSPLVTVTGSGFVPGASVQVNGTPITTTYVSGSEVTAQVPATETASLAADTITVENPAPDFGPSTSQVLYITPAQSPIVAANAASTFDRNGNLTVAVGGSGAGSLSAAAVDGSGTVAVAQYSADPLTTTPPSAVNAYFDVFVSAGSTFGSVQVTDCNLDGGSQVYYYNSTTQQWTAVSGQSYDAGTGCVSFTLNTGSTPSLTQLSGTVFGVQNAPPTMTDPGAQSVQYGSTASIPVSATDVEATDKLTLRASGLPAGLSLTDNGDGTGTISGTVTAPVGVYTATFTANDGYSDSSPVTVPFTITTAPLTITADDKSKVYGAADPTFTASYSGLVNGDSAAAIHGLILTGAPSASGVGRYSIVPSGASNPNYTITFVTGTETITPAPLTITADDQTTAYGQVPAYTWTGTGFVNGDSASTLATAPNSTPTCSASVGGSAESATTAPGIYPGAITCAGAVDPNYAISYQSGQLTIDPLLSLNEQGLPGSVPHQATLDGHTVSLPDSNVELAYGSSHSYSFPAMVTDSSSGTVYFTTDAGFSGPVTANMTDTAVYQSMAQIVSADLASGGIDNSGIGTSLTQQFAAVQTDIAAGNTGQALSDLQSFAAHVQAQAGQHLTAATAQALLADAQLVYAHLGGTGQV